MIDLRVIAESKGYRVALDESAGIGGVSKGDGLWLWQIPGKHGHVWVIGVDDLGVHCGSNRLIRRLLEIPGVRVHQRGDMEANLRFPPEVLDRVCDVIQARRVRRVAMTDEWRARLVVARAKSPICRG